MQQKISPQDMGLRPLSDNNTAFFGADSNRRLIKCIQRVNPTNGLASADCLANVGERLKRSCD